MGLPELTSDWPSPLIAAAGSGDSHRWCEKLGWVEHLCDLTAQANQSGGLCICAATFNSWEKLYPEPNISFPPPLHIHPEHFQNFFRFLLADVFAHIKIKLCRATIKNALIRLLSSAVIRQPWNRTLIRTRSAATRPTFIDLASPVYRCGLHPLLWKRLQKRLIAPPNVLLLFGSPFLHPAVFYFTASVSSPRLEKQLAGDVTS